MSAPVCRPGAWRRARRVGGLLGGLAAAGILLLAVAPAASAHATLLFTSPATGSAVPVPPMAVTLTFDAPVTLAEPPVIVTGPAGHRVRVGPARVSRGRSVVTVPVRSRLADGTYTVAWQAVSSDGDEVSGAFRFAVGPAQATLHSVTAPPSSPGQWPSAVLRWVLFAGLAMALGGLAGRALARRHAGSDPGPLPRPWALRASLAGLAAAAGLAALQLGGGNLVRGLVHPSLPRLVSAGPGRIAAAEAVSFAIAAVLLRLRRPGWAVVPLLAVAAAEGLRAHPEAIVPAGGALLTWAHLLPAALWAGMLAYVVRAGFAWRGDTAAVRRLIGAYSRAAIWLFAAVAATGVISALVLVAPLSALVTTDYGRVLIVKAVLVAAAAALALAGRSWLRRAPGARAGSGPPLPMRAETGLLAAVLAVTGLLTALPAPATPLSPLPFPPPASGPVVPLGGRAGEVGIYGTASAGQIVLQLSTPQAGSEGTGPGGSREPKIPATLTLAGPREPPHELPVRGCGPGCLVAPARWADGNNRLTLRVTPDGFPGGTVTLAVPWPPAPAAQLLRRMSAALRSTRTLIVHERDTSNTAGPSFPHQATISGSAFLASEPYAAGLAPAATQAPAAGGQSRLLLGYPAQDIWVALTVSPTGQPVAETEVDPGHLITRTFTYPHARSTG